MKFIFSNVAKLVVTRFTQQVTAVGSQELHTEHSTLTAFPTDVTLGAVAKPFFCARAA